MTNKFYKSLITILLISLFLPNLILAQPPAQMPETLDEAKELGEKALEVSKKELPGNLERIWKEEVLPLWQKMYNWVNTKIWDRYIWPWLQNIWQKIKDIFSKEVEERKPIIEEEFQKEKQELKEEAPEVGKSLWERFKELIR